MLSGRCLYSSLFRFNQTFNGETEIAGNSDRLVWSIKPTVGFSIEFEKPVRNAFFKSFLHQGFCNFAHLIYVTSSYSFLNCIGFMRSVVSNKIWKWTWIRRSYLTIRDWPTVKRYTLRTSKPWQFHVDQLLYAWLVESYWSHL